MLNSRNTKQIRGTVTSFTHLFLFGIESLPFRPVSFVRVGEYSPTVHCADKTGCCLVLKNA